MKHSLINEDAHFDDNPLHEVADEVVQRSTFKQVFSSTLIEVTLIFQLFMDSSLRMWFR